MIYINTKNRIVLFILSILFCSHIMISAESEKVESKKEGEGATFFRQLPFALGSYAMSSDGNYFYVAAHPEVKKSGNEPRKDFAVSRSSRMFNVFMPIAKEKVSIEFESDKDNPLFDSRIKHLSLIEEIKENNSFVYPIVVTVDEPDKIYVIDQHSQETLIGSSDEINDANGKPISQIEGLQGIGYRMQALVEGDFKIAFAIVRNHKGDPFGAPGSGLALLRMKYDNNTKKEEDSVDESKNTGSPEKKEDTLDQQEQTKVKICMQQLFSKSLAIDKTSAIMKIGSDLNSIKVTDMYWDDSIKRLFVSFHVEAGDDECAGAQALLIGKIYPNNFRLSPIVISQNAFTGKQSHIVGAIGKNAKVSLHKVRTMRSSNRLRYVIVLGGNGDPESTKRSVYALPLVVDRESNAEKNQQPNYCLAHRDGLPQDEFSDGKIRSLTGRYIVERAIEKGSLFTCDDEGAQVGGGQMYAGDISEIFVCSDAVFAVVSQPDVGERSGIFMSRALFDECGKIKRWSDWQRVAGAAENIFGAEMDRKFGDFVMMIGAKENNIRSVHRTMWGDGYKDGLGNLVELLTKEFPRDIEGIQGLFEFPYNTTALPNMTLLVATGFKKVALVQMGYQDGLGFVKCVGDFTSGKIDCKSGSVHSTITNDKESKVVIFSGGDIDTIGPVKAAEITSVGSGRLFVAGVEGVAVLVDANGDGWDIVSGLGPNFVGLRPGMHFKKVGDFRFVRKLINQDQFLYVLTDTRLARIDLLDERNNFVSGKIHSVELASLDTIPGISTLGTLLDFVVSDNVGLIATSVGLFRVGNAQDIAHDDKIIWTHVPIPAHEGSVRQILPISSTNNATDFARQGCDGMIYVLCSNYSRDRSQINRFTVKSGPVNDTTIVPLPDYFVEMPGTGMGAHSYFVNFGSFRKLINFDGALRLSASANNPDKEFPLLSMLPPGIVFRDPLPIAARQGIPLRVDKDSVISHIMRSSQGPLLIAGNFGLKVNE